MNISTIHVKNISNDPIFLTFTTNDSYRIDPGVTETISFIDATSIYYLVHYVASNTDLEFYDKENKLITTETLTTFLADYDLVQGVPPYRDVAPTEALDTFVADVKQNVEEEISGTKSVTINFMSGETVVQKAVVKSYEVGTTILGADLKTTYATIGDYDLDTASAKDLIVSEDESLNVINLSFKKAVGKATVKYLNGADSTEIKTAIEKTGEVGSQEVIKADTIDGFENAMPGQKTVTYTRASQEVVFTYTKVAEDAGEA